MCNGLNVWLCRATPINHTQKYFFQYRRGSTRLLVSTIKKLNLSQWRSQLMKKLQSVDQHLIPLLVSCNYFCFHFGIIIICSLCPSVHLASFPGVSILAWRRGEEECPVHTVVRMRLISKKSRKMGYPGIFLCNGDIQPQ